MMGLLESFFDIGYLGLVIFLGIRLFFEDTKGAKQFGIMAVLLGMGDAFHLIPRVMSHLTMNGFEKNASILSWGEFVTSITMTIFYILFYHYYVDRSGNQNKSKFWTIYLLAAIRIALVLFPQNLWGKGGSYPFTLIRNVPFLVMGMLIVYWTYQYKEKPGLQKAYLLIFCSFLFYIPVVVGSSYILALGAFMLPKTVMYVCIVLLGYRYFVDEQEEAHILKMSAGLLIVGLGSGVFYREFVKWNGWEMFTTLSLLHVHLLSLGFLFFILLYTLVKLLSTDLTKIRQSIDIYLMGLLWMMVSMMVKGIYQITSQGENLFSEVAFSGISGIGHIIVGVGLVGIMIQLISSAKLHSDR